MTIVTPLNDAIFPLAPLTPPDPFRLRVQKALTAAFEQITIANGFRSELGPGRVFRGRILYGDDDPLPMVSLLEEPIAPESDLSGEAGVGASGNYVLMVQGFVLDDKNNPTDPAHVLLADVKKRLAEIKRDERREDYVFRFGGKANTVLSVSWDGGVVRPPDEVSAVAYFWLRVTFNLAEDHSNPFG